MGAIVVSSADDWRRCDARSSCCSPATGSRRRPGSSQSKGFRVSASFLAIVLAMALLGPARPSVIGVVATLVDVLGAGARAGVVACHELSTFGRVPVRSVAC